MWTAFSLAVSDVFTPAGRRTLLVSLGATLFLLLALWIGASVLLTLIHMSHFHWLDIVIDFLGSLAALFVAWLLFPSLSMLVLGVFFDAYAAAIERAHYPDRPPARKIGTGEIIRSGLAIAVVAVVLNLLMLPIYFLPVINIAAYYAINGYLVGRTYFELVGLRRATLRETRALWRTHRGYFFIGGVIIAFLLSLPLFGFVAPLIGVAFSLHLFENIERHAPSKFVA